MKGIKICGECGNYNWKKHRCTLGAEKEAKPTDPFYDDCPLPDVVPMGLYELVLWERDVALKQLADHGIPFAGVK